MNDREEQMGEVTVSNSKKQVQALPLVHLRLSKNSVPLDILAARRKFYTAEVDTQYAVRGANVNLDLCNES
jgi:hypothetical protein